MKKLLGLASLFFSLLLNAQEVSQTYIPLSDAFLCQPGVSHKSPGKGVALSYFINPNFTFQSPDAENSSEVRRNEGGEFKLKIPLITRTDVKFLLGFQYNLERYNFENIEPANSPLFKRLNEVNLKTVRFAAYLLKPLNDKHYLSFRLGTSYRGDFGGFVDFSDRYAVYRIAGLFGIKKNKDLEYGFGVLFTHGFRNTIALPFGLYNRTFNEHWGIEAAIPVKIKMRYNFKPGSMILFGPEYASRFFSLDVQEDIPAIYHYRKAAIEFSAEYQQKLTNWIWISAKAGYAFNRQSKVEDVADDFIWRVPTSNSLLGQVSLFISPPKDVCEEELKDPLNPKF